MIKKILITGGGGYIGTNLVKHLVKKKYHVKVIDTFWFGKYLKKKNYLTIIKKDIRNIKYSDIGNVDCIIHLASIANDPAGDLDPSLTWDVNVLATYRIIDLAIKQRVKKFIFASSGSVYGIKKEKKVTEELNLEPVSEYNKSKMIAERILLSYKKNIDLIILRPATVCGYSPSMRLDVAVNALTFNALKNKKIKVFGGKQIRPNLHMSDMIEVYEFFINQNLKKNRTNDQIIYNVGFDNLSIINIAKTVKKTIKIKSEIFVRPSNDPRSYRQNSDRLLKLGFKKRKIINDAIKEIEEKFNNKKIKKNKKYFRINTLKLLNR